MGIQSFIRKGNKRMKERHNRKMDREIRNIKVGHFMNVIAIVWFIFIAFTILAFGCVLKEFNLLFDLLVAVLSLLVLLLGKSRAKFKRNDNLAVYGLVFTSIIALMIVVYLFSTFLIIKFHWLEDMSSHEKIARGISCIALLLSVKEEFEIVLDSDKDKTQIQISKLENEKK